MTDEKLTAIIKGQAAAQEIDVRALGLTMEDVSWVLNHLPDIREWADNERRIRELKNKLRASFPRTGVDGIGWGWRDEPSVRLLAVNGITEEIRKQARQELERRGVDPQNGDRRFTKRPTTEGDLR